MPKDFIDVFFKDFKVDNVINKILLQIHKRFYRLKLKKGIPTLKLFTWDNRTHIYESSYRINWNWTTTYFASYFVINSQDIFLLNQDCYLQNIFSSWWLPDRKMNSEETKLLWYITIELTCKFAFHDALSNIKKNN